MTTRRRKIADMVQLKGFMSASDAAAKIGTSVHTIYRWIKEGTLEGMKAGEHWYVKMDSLSQKVGPEMSELIGLSQSGGS